MTREDFTLQLIKYCDLLIEAHKVKQLLDEFIDQHFAAVKPKRGGLLGVLGIPIAQLTDEELEVVKRLDDYATADL